MKVWDKNFGEWNWPWSDIIKPWHQVTEDTPRVLVGYVGVDSGTVKIGDLDCSGAHVHMKTYPGDGGFPIFAELHDGRHRTVIDYGLLYYGDGEVSVQSHHDWKCPQCGGDANGQAGNHVVCINRHFTALESFTDYVHYEHVPSHLRDMPRHCYGIVYQDRHDMYNVMEVHARDPISAIVFMSVTHLCNVVAYRKIHRPAYNHGRTIDVSVNLDEEEFPQKHDGEIHDLDRRNNDTIRQWLDAGQLGAEGWTEIELAE